MSGLPLHEAIEQRLREGLQPESLWVRDDSEAHRGHAGAAQGGGHFEVAVVASCFEGKGRLARHRLVYDALADWMPHRIHALSIDARTPAEASQQL